MKWYAILPFLMFSVALVTATFEDDMASLEKDLKDEYTVKKDATKKKALQDIKDMSTADLIEELEKEFTKDSKDAHTKIEKKYRGQFDAILKKRADIERLLNQDISSLNQKSDNKLDILDLLDKAIQGSKVQHDEECQDKRQDCSTLKAFCKSHTKKLAKICAKTCGFCTSCTQKYSKEVCDRLAKSGTCTKFGYEDRMRENCPGSCGYCKALAPAKCSGTTYGCCWDRSTARKDDAGSNCPSCGNKYKFICQTFHVDCMNVFKPGVFMRKMCPKACGICDGACFDDPVQKGKCPLWKDTLKFCEKHPESMKFFCPKTCGMC